MEILYVWGSFVAIPKYDTIIVGGGISGAVCALLRARKGEKVAVVERSPYLSPTLNGFVKHGIYMDSGFHYVGSVGHDGLLRYLLGELGIDNLLNKASQTSEAVDHVRIMKPAFDFLFPQGWEAIEQSFCNAFPADKENIKRFLAEVKQLSEQGRASLIQKGGTSFDVLFGSGRCSLKESIDRCTSNPVLAGLLSCHAILYGMVPAETSMMFHSQIVGSYYESACFIDGGGRALVEVFEKTLRDANIDIICGRKVSRINLDDKEAFASVELETSDRLAADRCICTTHPKTMLGMMPEKAFSPAYRKRIGRLEETSSAVVLYGRCSSSSFKGNLILANEPHEFVDWAGLKLEERPLFISSPAKTSTSSVSVICPAALTEIPCNGENVNGRRPKGYKEWKNNVADRLIRRISDCVKDLLGNFELLDIATPLTFRDRLNSPEGGLYGIKHRIMDLPLLPRTAVKGLYLSGQAMVAPGVLGALCSSFLTERFVA
jgi:all-trans-retinol 13,14-reductase